MNRSKAQIDPAKHSQPLELASNCLVLIKEWAEMIKIEHTVFALPFALSGFILASPGRLDWLPIFWTILAFAGARQAAMTLNRLIDAEIDSKNPRTRNRSIPAGKISKKQAAILAAASFALMLWSANHLPSICLKLSPIAIAWLILYSYTKRFTWLCHLVLGIALGGAALGGWLAAGGQLSIPAPWLLCLAVSTWVAGFDIIYACQDVDFDKQTDLHSLPARFGLRQALNLSSWLHFVTSASLFGLGLSLSLGPVYWAGAVFVSIMLAWEHSLVSASDLTRVNAAFFNVNGCVSISVFLAILLDRCWRA